MSKTEVAFYVAPDGSDANSGAKQAPLGTVGEAIRRLRAVESAEKRVIVRGGTYYDVNIVLKPEDSDLTLQAAQGEQPVFYGGLPVTSWKREGDFYSAPLADVRDRTRDFRVIEVNNQFRQRARLPEEGAFTHLNEFDVRWRSSIAGGWARKPTEEELTTLKYQGDDLGAWLDVNNAELTIYHEWDESLVGLKSLDVQSRTVHFARPSGHPPGAFAGRNENAKTYVVWNIREGMKQPGQWYLDRTNERLVYWPLPSEDMSSIQVIAPSQEHMMEMKQGVKNVCVKGLTFSCSTSQLVTGGYAAGGISGAITGNGIQNVVFEDVTVRHIGGWAFRLSGKDISVRGCHIHHVGAGAIGFRGERCEISTNIMHDIGLAHQSAVALLGGGDNNTVEHNEIYNAPYCGVNNVGNNSVVRGNLIHNIKTFMRDGGAIYCFGAINVTISENVVFSDPRKGINVRAYYLDETSENSRVENNLAVNTHAPMLSHMTKNCFYINNVFIDNGEQIISCSNTSGLTFDMNILVAERITFSAPRGNPEGRIPSYELSDVMKPYTYADGITSMENNIFFSKSGEIKFRELLQYATTNEFDLEPQEGTLFVDPLMKAPGSGDFSFKAESLAMGLGIRQLSFNDAGCTGSFLRLLAQYYYLRK
ncbi:right-handed parallel beta-helix repeat-containing protein [Candidatus Poribacteria bacterium]